MAKKQSSKPSVSRTAGAWDPQGRWPIYFAATVPSVFEMLVDKLDNMLIAVNELEGKRALDVFDEMISGTGRNILVDSGVYWLSTQHAKAHGLTMNQALGLPPPQIDGFPALFERYIEICREHGDRVWGYIEIDQGGRENKIKTRAKLERLGLRPIPVYHPLNDGWDYFDYLAERYDRICFGNVVMADSGTRKRLIATAWERRRKYPHLWIHLLGVTPNELLTAFPLNSCDSSSWIEGLRWGHFRGSIGPQRVGHDISGLIYDIKKEGRVPGDSAVGAHLAAYDVHILSKTISRIVSEQKRELGADIGLFS